MIGDKLASAMQLYGNPSCINTAKALQTAAEKGVDIETHKISSGEIGCGALVAKLVRTKINDIELSKTVKLDNFLLSSDEEIYNKYIKLIIKRSFHWQNKHSKLK